MSHHFKIIKTPKFIGLKSMGLFKKSTSKTEKF